MNDEVVGHFRLGEEVGRGAHGVVHRAIDLQLERPVAIKLLAGGDDEAAARLLREARLASSLDHPHVGTIHEAGRAPDGRLFVAMALYRGGSLRDRLQAGRPAPAEAAALVRQVGSALAAAHAQGIVHGDVKPENVLFADDGLAKLVDFGVARAAGGGGGVIAGTPAYMAPEQAAGAPLTPAADVFALGLLFYELLAGRRAFDAEYEAALRYSLAHEEPAPLSSHGVALDPRVQGVLERALAKDPAARHADAGAFVAALDAALGPPPPPAAPPPDVVVAAARPRRRIALTLLVVLVAAAAAAAGWRALRPAAPAGPQSLAVLDFADLTRGDDPTLCDAVGGLVHVGLVGSSPVRVVSPEFLQDLRRRHFASAAGAIPEGDALELARRAGASLLVTGQLARVEDEFLLAWRLIETTGGRSVAAGRAQDPAITGLADRVIAGVVRGVVERTGGAMTAAPEPVASVTTANSTAYRHYVAGRLALDRAQVDEAIEQLGAATRLDSTFALAHLALSELHYAGTAAGVDYGRARACADRAWRHRDRLTERDRLRLEAWLSRLEYRVDHSLEVLRELRTRWPDDPGILQDLQNNLFAFWYASEALQTAEAGFRLYPDDDLHFGLWYQIGLEQTGRADEALGATRAYLARHRREPNAWDELGWRLLAAGRPDSAEAAFRAGLALDPGFLPSRQGLTWTAYAAGRHDEAVRRAEALLADPGLLPAQVVEVLTTTFTWPGLCVFHAEAGRYDAARAQFARAAAHLADPVSRLRNGSSRALLELRLGRPRAVLAWVDSLRTQQQSSDPTVARLAGDYGAVYGPLALAALDSLEAARALLPRVLERARSTGGQAVYFHRLAAIEIALRSGDGREALRLLDENAAQIQPPGGLIAVMHHESRALAHLLAGEPDRALAALAPLERVFAGDRRALVLRGRALAALGRREEAAAAYRRFLADWADADPGAAPVAEARARLAALGVT